MDTLPLETAQMICELACTDGGYTGQSLALVSKAYRAISRRTRFHSLMLAASPRRLQSFIALYERECETARGDKPRIRHLHVTFPRIQEVPEALVKDAESWLNQHRLGPCGIPLLVAYYYDRARDGWLDRIEDNRDEAGYWGEAPTVDMLGVEHDFEG